MKAMTSFTVKSLRDSAARTVVTIAGVAAGMRNTG